MKTMPKTAKELKNTFKNDEIETAKMNYLVGGDGTGAGGQPGNGEW